MSKRLLLFSLIVLLIPNPCLAAPKKKSATTAADRSLKAVPKGDGRRVALVIGNGAYKYSDSMPKLANPANDADDIAAALRQFGFDVTLRKNLSKSEMDNALVDFGRRSANSDAALFYYAGHGLQVKGQNYLIPVDANIRTEAQVPYNAINVNQLLDELDNSKSKVNIVMLDACRNNPISGSFRSGATRGLAPPASSPRGTVIVYATDPGNVAADGSGRNGLFTAGLLAAFMSDDLSLFGVLTKTSEVVEEGSNRQQSPYVNGPPSVQKNFSFGVGQPSAASGSNNAELEQLRREKQAAQEEARRARQEAENERKALEMERRGSKTKVAMAPRPQQPPARPVKSGSFTDPTTGMEFVAVPEGCGTIGGSQVCFDAFSIGKYEVTQGQWKKVMGSNPSKFSSCGDNCPVEQVSWNDAQQFISRLNSQSGTNYRLPTEAEWEYACRAGGTDEYCGSNNINAVAWYNGNSGSQTHPVGQKQANGWGIHDMSGNVWEWVQDLYGQSYPTGSKNPTGLSSGSYRVLRGGDWRNDPARVRVSNRGGNTPYLRDNALGFRLVAPVQ